MKSGGASRGYTIVEVMIFLVITGALLASSVFVFSRQQRRTQFTQGVRELEAELSTVINEVSSGFYPSKNDFSCSAAGGGPVLTAAPNGQGENEDCIFMGKVIQFGESSDYNAYTVVGQRQTSGGREVTTLDKDSPNSALQTLVAASNSGDPDTKQEYELPWGITFTAVRDVDANTNIGAVGFIMSLGSYKSSGDPVSGSQTVEAFPLANTSQSSNINALKTATRDLEDSDSNHDEIVLCLKNGEGDRRAAVIIGGNDRQLSISSVIDGVPESYGCPEL